MVKISKAKALSRQDGFTLIELLVVLAIIALLLTLSVPRYFQTIDTSKETILIKNLQTTREAIDQFYGDTGKYPNTLTDLIDRKYLRSLPIDPITESTITWILIAPDEQEKGNVYDLKSGAIGSTHLGYPFSNL